MSVKALKEELKCQILPMSGIKMVLLGRLKFGIVEKKNKYTVLQLKRIISVKKKKAEPNTAPGLSSFPKLAYWQILEPNSDKMLNPPNLTFAAARAPTTNKDANIKVSIYMRAYASYNYIYNYRKKN